jgi:hypothetical protein
VNEFSEAVIQVNGWSGCLRKSWGARSGMSFLIFSVSFERWNVVCQTYVFKFSFVLLGFLQFEVCSEVIRSSFATSATSSATANVLLIEWAAPESWAKKWK